nr:10406_t:CDS:2 [Entrophospora candida]
MKIKHFIRFTLIFIISTIFLLEVGHAKVTLESKVEKLNKETQINNGIVELDSRLYEEYTGKPRNYSMIILLTAMEPRLNCKPCRDFEPEFQLVASSWLKTANDPSRLYFGVLDFRDGKEVYSKLKLNNAPSIYYFPPTTGPYGKEISEPDRYDFNKHGFLAEELAGYLSNNLGTRIRIQRPFDYLKLFIAVFLLIGSLATIKLAYPYIKSFIWNKNTWATVTLVVILLMISGHMWNHIRGPPYIISQNGHISYIAPGYSNQLGMESQIVAIIYGVCAFSVISLITAVPKINDKTKQRFTLWMGVLVAVYSVLFSLFRLKNPGYP